MTTADLGLEPRRTAVLFVDFQLDVCAPGGRMVSQEPTVLARFAATRAVAARLLAEVRATARAAGDRAAPYLVHVCHRFEPGHPELDRGRLNGMSRAVLEHRAFEAGSAGVAFVPELAPGAGEAVLAKTSISPFETTDLATRLQRHQIDTVVVCGVVTHYAVLATSLAASDRGYQVIVPADACAAGDPARHDAAIAILRPLVTVTNVDEVVTALAVHAARDRT